MKETLLDKFNHIELIIKKKEENTCNAWLKSNEMPKFIYELAGYKSIREKKVTGIRIDSHEVCEGFIPSFKKRPTRKDLDSIIEYNELYDPNENHIGFSYTYSETYGSISGFDNLIDILTNNRKSFRKEDLIPELKKMKELYEPREGYLECAYCHKQRLPKDLRQATVISRMYINYKSNKRNYCKDSDCASHDQMAHEG